MNEHARLYIAVGIDVAVTLTARHAAMYKFTIVLEIDGKQFFTALDTANLTDLMIHVLSLLRTQQQLCARVDADRHIMEEPREHAALVDQHIQEFIAGNRQIILAGIADGNTKRNVMCVHQIHRCERLLIMSRASSAVIAFFKALNADRNEEVSNSQKVLTELLIDQRAVGERMESHVLMLLAETDDIILSDQRFTACKKISVNTELLAFGDDLIHHFVGKIHFITVFRRPAACAVQIARGRWIHQNDPWNIASVFFLHFQRSLVAHKTRFKACVQQERF